MQFKSRRQRQRACRSDRAIINMRPPAISPRNNQTSLDTIKSNDGMYRSVSATKAAPHIIHPLFCSRAGLSRRQASHLLITRPTYCKEKQNRSHSHLQPIMRRHNLLTVGGILTSYTGARIHTNSRLKKSRPGI